MRITAHGSGSSRSALFYKGLALVLVGCFAGYLLTRAWHRSSSLVGNNSSADAVAQGAVAVGAGAQPGAMAASAALTTGDHQLTARAAQSKRDPNDLANYVAPGQAPKMAEVIERLHDAGIHSGLGAFSPPGTSPPLLGLAVPEDYLLPEGYVRHFQATDDGQRIEPILMYSPDFEFFDSAGRRIDIPPDRVVPPALAPPGLPLRTIAIPPPIEPGSPSN